MQDKLQQILERNKKYTKEGILPTYIPELTKANKDALGIYICGIDNIEYGVGDWQGKFTIQSISKVIVLLLALEDRGAEYVFERVGMEPTGDAFNSMVRLEVIRPSKPFNPMINAGAIAVTSMIKGDSCEEKYQRMINFFKEITQNPSLDINQSVYESEHSTGDRNRAMAYFMRDVGVVKGNIEENLDIYFKQCSIEVDCKDVARLGRFLANNGIVQETGKRLIKEKYAKIAKTLMVTCGMYNASGKFAIDVGIPSKSGVGGGIMSVVPDKMGIGVMGPSLDRIGNSIAGVEVLKDLAREYNLSIF